MIETLTSLLPNLDVADVVDIALVSVLVYLFLLALKQTRTTFVVVGVALLGILYLTTVLFELRLTRYLLQLIVAVSLFGLIVLFDDELRAAAERALSWRPRWRRERAPDNPEAARVVEILISTVTDLARDRIGALIVIPGTNDPSRFVRGGSRLDGIVTEPLLKSIFDPHSLGHDGAALLVKDRIERFGCHLPLSTHSARIGKRGTRHAAALGLSERVDSLCLVVSEERGKMSIARHGELEEIDDLARLNQVLGDFYREINPAAPRPSVLDAFRQHPLLKIASVLVAFLLWFLVVQESTLEYHQFVVEPRPVGLREDLHASIEPQRLRVIVSGPRRSFYFKKPEEFGIDVKLFERGPGTHDVFLVATDVTLPEGLSFVNIAPTRNVRVTIE